MNLSLPEGPSPPHSPDLEAASCRVRDSKENKEPSPKMRRRRSVKISSIPLEQAQWQNDALHILTSAHDYRSMNDFLMKKVRQPGPTSHCVGGATQPSVPGFIRITGFGYETICDY